MVHKPIFIFPSIEMTKALKKYRTEFEETGEFIHGCSSLENFSEINDWLEHLKAYESKETLPNKNFVPSFQYVLYDILTREVLGSVSIRTELNEALRQVGGHIGYSVAPSKRRKGYGCFILEEALKKAKNHGLNRVLVTCDEDNVASAKVIEANGGILDSIILDSESNKQVKRYWINLEKIYKKKVNMLIENYNLTFPKDITSIEDKMFFYFNYFDLEKIAKHSLEVATEAKRLAQRFQIDEEKAYLAALLHDIGNVVPSDNQLLLAKELKLTVVEAEETLPVLLHQKLSAYLAEKVFLITNQELLSAMACHTTLKAQATDLDKLIFIADKVKWDHSDRAPFLDNVEQALTVSLNQACFIYLEWAFNQGMPVIHPMFQEAYTDLKYS